LTRFRIAACAAACVAVLAACASILNIGDITCSAGDAGTGELDPCVGDAGITVLPLSGAINDLRQADAETVIAVGYSMTQGGAAFTAALAGLAGLESAPSVHKTIPSVANSVTPGLNQIGFLVVGGTGSSMLVRHYNDDFKVDNSQTFATLDGGTLIREGAANQIDLYDNVVGTTAANDLFFMKMTTTSTLAEFSHVVYSAATPLRATAMSQLVSGDGTHSVTIVADTPDASLGLAMVRFTVGLALDSTFGDGGVITARFGDGGSARAIASQQLESWVAGQAAGASGFVLAHVETNGTIDTTFTAPGTNRGANAILWLTSQQRLLVAGFDEGKLALARFTLDAGLDPTFGDGGVLNLGIDGELRAFAVTDTHIVAGGTANVDGGSAWVLVWLAR
jgi:hypothetical protein